MKYDDIDFKLAWMDFGNALTVWSHLNGDARTETVRTIVYHIVKTFGGLAIEMFREQIDEYDK